MPTFVSADGGHFAQCEFWGGAGNGTTRSRRREKERRVTRRCVLEEDTFGRQGKERRKQELSSICRAY